jgi:hypothetical protein
LKRLKGGVLSFGVIKMSDVAALKILLHHDVPVAKFKADLLIEEDVFQVVPFDLTNPLHKKAKFITSFNKNDFETVIPIDDEKTGFSVFDLLLHHSTIRHGFYSIERKDTTGAGLKVSNGELKRWILNNSLSINGEIVNDPNKEIDFPVESLVLFPNNTDKINTLV